LRGRTASSRRRVPLASSFFSGIQAYSPRRLVQALPSQYIGIRDPSAEGAELTEQVRIHKLEPDVSPTHQDMTYNGSSALACPRPPPRPNVSCRFQSASC
jgi:hypothetical protein